jgi:hypothetical protein
MKLIKKEDSVILNIATFVWMIITFFTLVTSPLQVFIPGIPLAIALFCSRLEKTVKDQVGYALLAIIVVIILIHD